MQHVQHMQICNWIHYCIYTEKWINIHNFSCKYKIKLETRVGVIKSVITKLRKFIRFARFYAQQSAHKIWVVHAFGTCAWLQRTIELGKRVLLQMQTIPSTLKSHLICIYLQLLQTTLAYLFVAFAIFTQISQNKHIFIFCLHFLVPQIIYFLFKIFYPLRILWGPRQTIYISRPASKYYFYRATWNPNW